MEREIIILIDKKSSNVEIFLETITSRKYISFRELRKMFYSTIAYNTIQNFIYKTNNSLKIIDQSLELFSMEIIQKDEITMKIYKINPKTQFEKTKHHYILKLK